MAKKENILAILIKFATQAVPLFAEPLRNWLDFKHTGIAETNETNWKSFIFLLTSLDYRNCWNEI